MISGLTNEFGLIIPSVANGTQPTTTYGTSITPGASNTYGSYTSVLAGSSLTADAYGLEVIFSAAYSDGFDRGMLATIGFDPAGGTTFTGLGGVAGNEISNLLCSGAYLWWSGASTFGGGVRFYFPIFIKSGTSIGVKAQTNAASAGTMRAAVKCFCQPSRPDAIRAGSFVRTFGANTASTDGVSVTQGTASEGSWTEVGTAADSLWYLETAVGARSNAQVAAMSATDFGIGDASNKRMVVHDSTMLTGATEHIVRAGVSAAYCNIASGDKIYARSQASAAQTGFSVAAYGVGG